MQFAFDCESLFNTDAQGFVILRGKELSNYAGFNSYNASVKFKQGQKQFQKGPDTAMDRLCAIIDRMGCASATVGRLHQAQGLPQTITCMNRFAGSDQRLYLKVEGSSVQGFIKVGGKDLFYREPSGRCREISPLCVLDFYVHESVQRQGLGKSLFLKMLSSENVAPAKLAYDRPSPKLIKFLQKHFGLSQFVPQNNNFVIFDDFFKVAGSDKTAHSLAANHRSEGRVSRTVAPHEAAQRKTDSKPPNQFAPSQERGFMDLPRRHMNATAPLKPEPGEEFNKFQSNANTLLRFQGQYRDVYHHRGKDVYNPKYEKKIEELE